MQVKSLGAQDDISADVAAQETATQASPASGTPTSSSDDPVSIAQQTMDGTEGQDAVSPSLEPIKAADAATTSQVASSSAFIAIEETANPAAPTLGKQQATVDSAGDGPSTSTTAAAPSATGGTPAASAEIQTSNPDGSISVYTSSGALLETDFADGSRRVVGGSGSAYTATFYGAGGSFVRYESDLQGGTAYYSANGQSLEFDFAVGGSVVKFAPDGSSVQTNTDGTTLLYALDGTITVRNPNGVAVQVYAADHSWKSVTSDGWLYYSKGGAYQGSEIESPDGTARFYTACGTLYETKFSMGNYDLVNADGSVSDFSASGQLAETDFPNGDIRLVSPPGSSYTATWVAEDGSFIKFEADLPGGTAYYGASGKPVEFDYAVGGSVVLFSPDGSATQTNTDGSKIDYRTDGTASVLDRNGIVVQIYAADHSWKSLINRGWAFYSASGSYIGEALTETCGSVSCYDAAGRLTESDAVDGAKTLYGADGTLTHLDATGAVIEVDYADGSRRVLDPGTGSTSSYDANSRLTETDYADGSRRVVNGPASPFGATWFAPDGTFVKYEADLPGGTAYYGADCKPSEFDFAVGGSVVKFASNGSAVQMNVDGTTLAYALDGTITVADPTGRIVQVYAADHSWKSVTADGWDFYSPTQVFLGSEVDQADGDKQLYDASGRLTQTDLADGGKVTYDISGTVERFAASGSLVETDSADGTKQILQPGTGYVLCYDATGRLTKNIAPDGTTQAYAADGIVTTYNLSGRLVEQDFTDGSKQLTAQDGDISFYDDEGHLTQVEAPCGSCINYTLDGTALSYDAAGVLETITSPEPAGATQAAPSAATRQGFLAIAESNGLVAAVAKSGAPAVDARAGTTSLSAPTITGTALPGSGLELYDIYQAGVQLVATGTTNASGHWTLTPATPLQAGANLLSVVQVGSDGTMTPSTSIQLTVVDGTPSVPVVNKVCPPVDKRALLTVQGTGQPADQVELGYRTASGENVIGYSPVDASGSWQVEIPEDALPFGSQQLSARALDAAGNVGAWSGGTVVEVTDPEATAQHVGQDLSARLANDAATGVDATADLQAVADEAPGGPETVLDIPTGTYVLSHTVYLKSGTIIDSPGTSFVAANSWQLPPAGSVEDATIHYAMFSNADWSGSGTPDSGIELRDVSFNWRGTDSPGAAAVRILNAQNVLVANCAFTGSNSGTAFEADDGAVVKNSISYNTSEYGFDNWYGPKHTVIEDNTVNSGWFGGISLTASPTSGTGPAQAQDNAVVGNDIYGFDRIGIDVNTLDEDSSETDTLIADNYVSGTGRGIGVIGPTQDTLVDGNTVLGSNLQAIEVENINPSSGQLDAHNVEVSGNAIGALDMRNSAVAAVVVQANGGSVVNNSVDGGTFPTAFWVPSSDLLLADDASSPSGSGQQTATWWSSAVSVEGMSNLPGTGLIGTAEVSDPSGVDFTAPEGQGLILAIPDVAGAVFTAIDQISETASNIQPDAVSMSPGDGAAGEPGTLTVFGSGNGDSIHLGGGNDLVYIGGSDETVLGGGGNDTFYAGPSSMSADIDGGSGTSQLVLVPDDQSDAFVLGNGIKDISSVKLVISDAPVSVTLNDIPFLEAYASDQGVSIAAGGPDQTIHMGQGVDIMTGWSGGSTTFSGNSLSFYGDTILDLRPTDVIDYTDMAPTAWWDVQSDGKGGSYIMAYDGHMFSAVDTPAVLDRSTFSASDDGHHGLAITMRS